MKKPYLHWFFVLGTGLFLSACSDDKTIEPPIITDPVATAPSRYVVASAPVGSSGVADYLLTTSDLSQGTISTVGKGIEQDGSYRYYITHKGKFFSLLYGQGNPGAVTTYTLSEAGELVKSSDFQSETVQVFAPAGDDILTIKVPRSGNESASWFRINADQSKIVGEGQINIVRLAGNGERAHFTWATQVGDKIFAPYMSIKGAAPDVFGTAYPDSSWIAVFSYPAMQLEKVIKDNRTSFIGSYFNNGLLVDENGDTYAFSPAVATSSGKPAGTKPSAFVRIKKGTTEFDQSYYFNVQEKSGGKKVIGQTYLGKGKSLLYMLTDAANQYGPTRLAISDLYNQTFTWVTGTPESIASRSASYNNNTVSADGKTIFVGINTDAGSWVYAIDIATATARQGLKVEGGAITAIVKVK
ncbi:DUF4374 domain-containing protein [Dyadobacter flavalbus]|uniref:DUF4374 domain-containing protein n=1 Tax=Dyadobacter flavalbus TaxID=2579942 RepID=A0A5M8QTI3_9BACT|nr:DUF4374 domain-containing protein [Dyadobacter flavalbus]KAA6438360.1 DUF4374 domain-containing protein [Dyadobacter flavalbus]